MPNPSFSLDQLMNLSPGLAAPADVVPPLKQKKSNTVHFQISKAPSLAKHRKALKGLMALLDNSPTVKTGGITAEISRDRDKGRP